MCNENRPLLLACILFVLDVLIPVFTFQGMEREQRRVGLHKL